MHIYLQYLSAYYKYLDFYYLFRSLYFVANHIVVTKNMAKNPEMTPAQKDSLNEINEYVADEAIKFIEILYRITKIKFIRKINIIFLSQFIP